MLACIAVFTALPAVVFVAQNSGSGQARVSFLTLHAHAPLTFALWAAVVATGTLTLAFGTTRALRACRILPPYPDGDGALTPTCPTPPSHTPDTISGLTGPPRPAYAPQPGLSQNLDRCA